MIYLMNHCVFFLDPSLYLFWQNSNHSRPQTNYWAPKQIESKYARRSYNGYNQGIGCLGHLSYYRKRMGVPCSMCAWKGCDVCGTLWKELAFSDAVHDLRECFHGLLEIEHLERKELFFHALHGPYVRQTCRHGFYSFLKGYSGYNQVSIALEDKEKTTSTCNYGTFAVKMMSFRLYNVSTTLYCCMMLIFFDLVDKIIEVFMDDYS